METRIHEALNETYQNYILPFFLAAWRNRNSTQNVHEDHPGYGNSGCLSGIPSTS